MKITLLFGFIPIIVFCIPTIQFNLGFIICIPISYNDKNKKIKIRQQIVHARRIMSRPLLHSYRYRNNARYRLDIEIKCVTFEIKESPNNCHILLVNKHTKYLHTHHNLQNAFSEYTIKSHLLAALGIPHITQGVTVNT